MLSSMNLFDWVGVVGSVFIATAYFLVSTGRMQGEAPSFQWLNLIGAVLILISLYYRPNAGAILIEILWIAIAVYSLGKNYLKR